MIVQRKTITVSWQLWTGGVDISPTSSSYGATDNYLVLGGMEHPP